MTTQLIEAIARGLCRDGGLCVGFCHKSRCYSAIAAYGAQAQSALTAITEAGYAIVPIEPTEAMVLEGSYILAPDDTSAPRIWQAMLAAAAPIDSEKGE